MEISQEAVLPVLCLGLVLAVSGDCENVGRLEIKAEFEYIVQFNGRLRSSQSKGPLVQNPKTYLKDRQKDTGMRSLDVHVKRNSSITAL
nr:hypothetical protein BaRGS_013375 [Batillaria attramentaria]